MMKTDKSSNRKVISSVQNALKVLNLFNAGMPELGNGEIARQLDMDPGTVAGIVYTLRVNKYLDQNLDNRKYRLGLKIAERATVLLNQLDLRKTASHYLEKLRDWCGESVNLAILDGKEVVYIERMFGTHSLGIRSELGKRAPVHATSLGKAIAANLPETEYLALFNNYNFYPVTSHTITDPQGFAQEIVLIRARGYAVDEQENELGGRCVGVPIFDHLGYPIAGISISVPIQRLPPAKVPELGEELKKVALCISKDLGYENY